MFLGYFAARMHFPLLYRFPMNFAFLSSSSLPLSRYFMAVALPTGALARG